MAYLGSSVVVIEELDAPSYLARKLELRGPAMPHRPAAWKTEQRVTTEWYQGNPIEATQQVLGPRESDSSWEGMWRLTMMLRCPSMYTEGAGNPTQVTQPWTLRDILDAMLYSGRKLRVIWWAYDWKQNPHSIIRVGRAKDWEFPHDRLEDIGWKINWAWSGRGGSFSPVISTREDMAQASQAAVQAAADNVSRAIADAKIKSYKNSIVKSASHLTLGQLEALANAPKDIVDSFGRVIQQQADQLARVAALADKFRRVPYQIADSAVRTARNLVTLCNQFHDTMSRNPPELSSLKQDAADLTRATKYFGQTLDAEQALARQAQATADAQRKQQSAIDARGAAASIQSQSATSSRTVIAIHITKEGDTAVSLSQQYYNSPDHAEDILKANKLPPTTVLLKPGRPLIIPVLDGSTGGG